MKLDWQRRGYRHSISALLAVALMAAVAATAAMADAPDPKIPPQTPSASVVSVTHNAVAGTTTVTVKGGWVWTTHNSDCNTNRSGAGFAVDWNDPLDPGFHVTTLNGVSIDVGSTLAVNTNTVDNVVHPTPGNVALGGSGDDTDVATPSQFASWRGGCGTDTFNFNGKLEPEGIWGPRAHVLNATGADTGSQVGISHTYLDSSLTNGINICAIMYDVHPGKTPSQNGGVGIPGSAKEITAGGAGRNDDNGAEKNSKTPVGNACVPVVIPVIPLTKTRPAVLPNDTAHVAGSSPTGTVKFDLFGPGDSTCSGTPAFTQTVGLSGGSASTSNTTFKASTIGVWRWRLTYSGDSHNPPKTSACGLETFVIASA